MRSRTRQRPSAQRRQASSYRTNETRSRCEASYLPVLDRLVVMAHGDTYWHGHPTPLACPEGRSRKVISAYYYVASPSPEDETAHGAIWAEG